MSAASWGQGGGVLYRFMMYLVLALFLLPLFIEPAGAGWKHIWKGAKDFTKDVGRNLVKNVKAIPRIVENPGKAVKEFTDFETTKVMRAFGEKCDTGKSLAVANGFCEHGEAQCTVTWKWRWVKGTVGSFKHSFVVVESGKHDRAVQFHWTAGGLCLERGMPDTHHIATRRDVPCCKVSDALKRASEPKYNVGSYSCNHHAGKVSTHLGFDVSCPYH
uniref:Uncharacterized protein n=1 Tax=Zooxanthella nutricula TaxID=1333877 RepID=A0A6V0GZF0_9DINO